MSFTDELFERALTPAFKEWEALEESLRDQIAEEYPEFLDAWDYYIDVRNDKLQDKIAELINREWDDEKREFVEV